MNERIKLLVEQATVRGEEYLPGNDGHPTPTVYFDKEKFAELIVKECAKVCHEQALIESEKGSLKSLYKEVALDDIGCKIAKHFGVEE